MATNVFFKNFTSHGEQQVYEDLIVEYIKMSGDDMYYVPYTYRNKDEIYGEDDLKQFNKAYLIEIFVRTYDGFEGDGSFMSKFGLEIRDQVTFTLSRRRFMDEIGDVEQIPRPREGDLIYFPLNKKVFEIKFVDNKPFFYPFGELFTYDLYCELFEYSSEDFNTGIPEIDSIEGAKQNMFDYGVLDGEGKAILASNGLPILTSEYDPVVIDPIDDSDDLQSEADDIIDWTVADPFSESGKY